ncbi:glutamine amidotransferase [Tessaracoccus sp. Z1128]
MRVLFVGESWSVTEIHVKGFDSFVTSRYEEAGLALRESLDRDGFSLTYLPSQLAVEHFPDTVADLSGHDVILFSDIGSNSLLLPSKVFREGGTAPNRLEVIRDWVDGGGGFGMIGGYMSFQGIEGKANYRNTALADVLPVDMIQGDDRIETPQGSIARGSDHPILAGVEGEWPPLLGYQRLQPRSQARVVATFPADPLMVIGTYGSGRTLAYASDIDTHWAPTSFTTWDGFPTMWRNAVRWLAGEGDPGV